MEQKVIIANSIGFIAFLISLFAYHKQEKKNIFKNTLISNLLNLIQYILLSAYGGTATKIIAIFRDFSIVKQEKYNFLKSKKVLAIFVIAYLTLMVITFNGFISIFSLLAAMIYTIFCWNGDVNVVRYVRIFTNILWLIYNIYFKSYTGAMTNFVYIISTIIAIKNSEKLKNNLNIKKGNV